METLQAIESAAKREDRTDPSVTPQAGLLAPDPAPLPPIPQGTGTGEDPQDFVRAHRIHVKDGSLFIDPYLVIHPRELDPAREQQLRAKLLLTYSINNPSFYESPERAAIALNLGQMVPVSLAAKRSALMNQVKQFNAQVDNGADAQLTSQLNDKRQPFAAIVRDTTQHAEVDPAGLELLKNGLGIYLLIREKLTRHGYYHRLTDYVTRYNTPDQILGDLADNLGIAPQTIREAALKGGIKGVGEALGLDQEYIDDARQVARYAATQDFGYNVVEHWYLGRQLLGGKASLEEKITAGLDARITAKIGEYRGRVRHHYDVPTPVQAEERRIADALKLTDPIQRKLMYALGYEICFSPEMTADDISFYRGVYGLHRKAANDLRDIRGTYRIYFAGKGELEGSMRTLVHEVAHNFWPDQFTPKQVQDIDQLVTNDAQRFEHLHQLFSDPQQFERFNRLIGAYRAAGTPDEKQAVVATANEMLGAGFDTAALMPTLHDAYEFKHLISYAQDTLQVEGARYAKSGYETPQERFREVISRYAELRQVRLRNASEMMDFLCPHLGQVWSGYYLPHLEKVYQRVLENSPAQSQDSTVRATPDRNEAPAPAPKPEKPEAPHPEPKRADAPTEAPAADDGKEAACRDTQPSNRVQTLGIQVTPAIAQAQQALQQMHVRCAL